MFPQALDVLQQLILLLRDALVMHAVEVSFFPQFVPRGCCTVSYGLGLGKLRTEFLDCVIELLIMEVHIRDRTDVLLV